MNLKEKREQERVELAQRREAEKAELQQELCGVFSNEAIEVISISDCDDGMEYKIKLAFTLDGYRQIDDFYWICDDSQSGFIGKVKKRIDYIKDLRGRYPDYCKQNDFIQSNSAFNKTLHLTHMGYDKRYDLCVNLADYLKLPNSTECGCGGGDYEIKRTTKRVDEYNKNIDTTIDFLLDCISELKQRKYPPKQS